MKFRLLEYFVAIAEERHFARAADRCNVTQPTLSAGLVMLERQLGKRLIERDRRFIGLTPEGEAILPHVRTLLAQYDELQQVIDAPGPLRAELRLGAIPAAMPFIGRFVATLAGANPQLRIAIRQLTSEAILRGIAGFELDAGLTYLGKQAEPGMRVVSLYEERYVFATPAHGRFAGRASVTLAEAVSEPLCLLHQGMQNRRILDGHLAQRQLAAGAVATTDSYLALLSMVAGGQVSSIVTDSHGAFIGPATGVRLIPIADLSEPNRVGLVAAAREPLAPVVRAAIAAAQLCAEIV